MYVKTETDSERPLMLVKHIESWPGGVVIDISNIDTARVKEIKEGAIVGMIGDGLWGVVKTAIVVSGGGSDSPRVEKNHLFIVGDYISDGIMGVQIEAIETGEDGYDVLNLTDDLVNTENGNVLYACAMEYGPNWSTAVAKVTDVAGKYLEIQITSPQSEGLRDKAVSIKQAADDNLAITIHQSGNITISLAKTTASKNNASEIQTLLQSKGGVFQNAVVNSVSGWDNASTGAVLTDPAVIWNVDGAADMPAYPSPTGITMNTIDVSQGAANQSVAVLTKGTVNFLLLPYRPTQAMMVAMKNGLLSHITFYASIA